MEKRKLVSILYVIMSVCGVLIIGLGAGLPDWHKEINSGRKI